MILRNKKTGEILNGIGSFIIQNPNHINCESITKYNSLAELNEEWEDYEKPKEHFVITCDGKIITTAEEFTAIDECEEIGNYFETKEEAKKAVEKLKAWKRLEDRGFKFVEWQQHGITEDGVMDGAVYFEDAKNVNRPDLDLLFGGEE